MNKSSHVNQCNLLLRSFIGSLVHCDVSGMRPHSMTSLIRK